MKITLKTALLIALILIVTAIPVWAGQGVGSSPYTSDLLVSGLNTGKLSPGQEYWYAFSRLDLGDQAYNSVILSLNFEAEGRAVASRVNFQIFNFEQVDAWLRDSSGPVDNLGLGTPASADFDVNTGERFWAGPVETNEVYYVRIFNLSPSPVQFRLTALGQKNTQIEQFLAVGNLGDADQQAIPAAVNIKPEMAAPVKNSLDAEATILSEMVLPGRAPFVAAPAAVPQRSSSALQRSSSASQRSLKVELPVQPDDSPASTSWLLAAQAIDGLPPPEAAAWLMSAATLGWLPLGNSSPALVPTDPNQGVPIVSTGNDDDDGPDAAQVPAPPPDPTLGDNIYPNQPLRLLDGTNVGRLSPKSEHWYTFTAGTVDDKIIENFSLTMFFTPGEPNLARNVIFEMFTADQYHIWERGTPKDMEHFGAGSWVSRDGDYNTGERLWHGTVVDGGKYFVKISNDTSKWVDYYLITGDIYNAELGSGPDRKKVTARVVETTPTGKDIGSPLPIGKGSQTGRLAAGTELWFQFEHKNPSPDGFEFDPYLIELFHTPGAGYVTNHVNFEIYPYQEQHIWRRGDTDQIKPLGVGSDLAYNKVTDTHTWVWDGHLVSNTIYFIRLRNGSVSPIDYDLLIRRR